MNFFFDQVFSKTDLRFLAHEFCIMIYDRNFAKVLDKLWILIRTLPHNFY